MMAGMNPGMAQPAADKDDGKLVNLSSAIDKADCFARNVAPGFPMTNLFIGDSRLGCKSDADEQLILHISFHDFVRIKSIKFTEFNQGVDPDQNPTTVKLYVNRSNLGFEDIDDVDPTQELTLTPELLKEDGEAFMTRFVKFQRVKSLTLFIEDNNGAEISSLGMLTIMGRPVQTTNMSDFKKKPDEP
mmetsp:Transcript_2619/g.7250  ORF Transcript_2619/g.7250 Transcript_2619/m.7250 type:complete len:188 (-) Transcript_2619:396-959(-)|eukprot:CAMPEP_0198135014 /NCGR_PEP_ID=MMETSP1442-20131203/60372_1 /TAXON_ID= /ORGANISM="Craspedostauros australis, Strain CCMP3328" /LENGTH=187 /DNA_ID=CAMNT_0043796175 /DNA_START=513 /DNA_END=1076 /DNA_ORIENTATION=+